MAELLAIGQDLKNLTVVDMLNKDGSANLQLTGNSKYKPELRLTPSEVASLVKTWTPKPAPSVSASIVTKLSEDKTSIEIVSLPTGTTGVTIALLAELGGETKEYVHLVTVPTKPYTPPIGLPIVDMIATKGENTIGSWAGRLQTIPIAPTPPTSKPIVGVNGGVGWGPSDAVPLITAGFTGVRIEDGVAAESPQATIVDKFDPSRCSVVVGNTNDNSPLTSVNVSAWTTATVERIKALLALGFTKFEAGNEMYLKANAFDAKTYAAMVMSLYNALDAAGIKTSVGVSCVGDIAENPQSPNATWLRSLITAQPGLATRADYWIAHPYPANSGKISDTGWHGNCGPAAIQVMVEAARELKVKNNVWALTEFGVQLSGPDYATGFQEHQAAMCKEYMAAFLAIPQVESLYYFSVHDTGEGTFGLVTTPSPAGPLPWEPRPILNTVASFI